MAIKYRTCCLCIISVQKIFFNIIKIIVIFIFNILSVLSSYFQSILHPKPSCLPRLTPSILVHILLAPPNSNYAPKHFILTNPQLDSLYIKLPFLFFSAICLKKCSLCLLCLFTQPIILSYISYTSVLISFFH